MLARAETRLGGSLVEAGHFAVGIPWLRDGIEHARAVGEERAAAVAAVHPVWALGSLERHHEALAVGREARALVERAGDDGTLLAQLLENEAAALPSHHPEFITRNEQVLAMRRADATLAGPHELSGTLVNLGSALSQVDPERARALLSEALAIRQETYGPDHRHTLEVEGVLAQVDDAVGDYAGCVERATRVYWGVGDTAPLWHAVAAQRVAGCLARQGDIDGVLEWSDRAIEAFAVLANEGEGHRTASRSRPLRSRPGATTRKPRRSCCVY